LQAIREFLDYLIGYNPFLLSSVPHFNDKGMLLGIIRRDFNKFCLLSLSHSILPVIPLTGLQNFVHSATKKEKFMTRTAAMTIALLFLLSGLLAQSAKEPVKVTDMLKINSISGVSLNKDGTKAVFTVTRIEPDGDSKWDFKNVNHIYIVPTDGSAPPKELTVREGSSQAAWSPDGKKIAFVRLVDGKPQIFIMPVDGGEPLQFTHFKYGAGTPKWSPDGKKILFSSNPTLKDLLTDSLLNPGHELPRWPIEQPGFTRNEPLHSSQAKPNPDGSIDEIRAYLDNDLTDKKAKLVTRLNFQDELQVNTDINFNQYLVQSVVPGSQPVRVTHGFYRYFNVDFTPDGKQLIITGDIDSTEHPDRSLESEIFLADSNGNHLNMLLGEKDKVFFAATLSPSGKWLAFQHSTTSFVEVPELAIMPMSGGAKEVVNIPFDRNKIGYGWSGDEKYLYFAAQSTGGGPMYRLNMETRKVDQLSDFNSGTQSFDVAANHLIFARTEVRDPSELYIADAGMQDARVLTHLNDGWLQNRKLSYPEKHVFKNSKGMDMEYWVMKPVDYTPGKKYPLLLEIHGGPSAMWGPGETTMWHEFQFFCGKGYGVVYCNPRGSGGYGLDFLRGNINDWGTGPTSDVLAALDKTTAEGWADTTRLLVTGGSYAGYLVAWIIGHDHRFKAACSQRGVYDLATFFGEGNAWRLVPNYFGGYPWDPKVKAILQRESPITYVQNITTPFIIFHGENDRRTGFVQGEMLYRSLKVLNRPVEYVRHPGATHEITRSGDNRQRMDQMLRTYEFFERWLPR